MQSTVFNMQFTGFRSPPRPPSRRLPSVASGENHYDDDFSLWAGSTLTTPVFGPNSGVHHRQVDANGRFVRPVDLGASGSGGHGTQRSCGGCDRWNPCGLCATAHGRLRSKDWWVSPWTRNGRPANRSGKAELNLSHLLPGSESLRTNKAECFLIA